LSWTHILALLPLKDHLARAFYVEMCRVERWSVRTLRQKIGGILFECTAVSKNSEELIRRELTALRDDGLMSPELIFRDPCLLDFPGLSGACSERDL
jgi:predicted nuclease of restriction endonuclease-like (RecB) superfamily